MTDREKPKRERHGMNKSPEHRIWVGMKQRCYNPNKKDYKWYGAKGITVCDEWLNSFVAFFEHVGNRPSPSHSIDRIDTTKGYEKGNVKWSTQKEQIDNTTVVRMVEINGKTQSISAWEREMGLSKGRVKARENSGWSTQEAILTPSRLGQKIHMVVKRDYSERTRDRYGRYLEEKASGPAIVRAAADIGGSMP